MKKSRIAKLALMGASITALAATLTTSTYAWYVSNKTANVNAVTGQTSAGTSDNTIALSVSGAKNDYHKTISLADFSTDLAPVLRKNATLDASGNVTAAYYGLNETGSTVVLKDTAESTGWYTYVFFMLASVDCTVAPVLTVTNTTTNFSTLTQINYSPSTDNKITGAGIGETFTCDAVAACRISLAVETGTAYGAAADAAYVKGTGTPVEYTSALTAAATGYTAPTATGYGSTHATGGAHNYYNFMTGKTLADATKVVYGATGATALGQLSLTAGIPVRLYYSVWLDGAMDNCFNACQGQSLSIAFDYTATPTTTPATPEP